MKKPKSIFLLLVLSMCTPLILQAQVQTMSFDASSSLMLQEFSAMLTLADDQISVAMRMGGHGSEPGEDQLERGDIIIMMNGTRAKDIEALREIYDALDDEAEIKIGVQRGEARFIVRGIKGDIPESGGMQMVMEMDEDSDGATPTVISELGLILLDRDESVVVERLIEQLLPGVLKELGIQGYAITQINGEKPTDAAQARLTLVAIEVGDEVDITFEKNGDEKAIKFNMPEPKGSFSMSGGN